MKRYTTHGIILRRVDFGEADRIITFLTPEHGKVSAMAKGVRKPKSKLAGGIELFSVSELSLLSGKGNLDQLISSRLENHFRDILNDYDSMQFAYDAIDLMNKFTEDDVGSEYYDLLETTLGALASQSSQLSTVRTWFYLSLMRIHGHLPNLLQDSSGNDLAVDKKYSFDIGEGSFSESAAGQFGPNEIKAWRILAQANLSETRRIKGITEAAEKSVHVLEMFAKQQL